MTADKSCNPEHDVIGGCVLLESGDGIYVIAGTAR